MHCNQIACCYSYYIGKTCSLKTSINNKLPSPTFFIVVEGIFFDVKVQLQFTLYFNSLKESPDYRTVGLI